MHPYTVSVCGMQSLEKALNELPAELHSQLIPEHRILALQRTSKTMRAAVQKQSACACTRKAWISFPRGQGLLESLNDLMVGCDLTALSLGRCELGEGGARVMLEFLRLNTTLRDLDLSRNDIGLFISDAEALAGVLRLNTTLRELDLSWNEFRDERAQTLAEALHLNTSLTWLCLCGNDIGDDEAEALATAVRRNFALRSLILDHNRIQDRGGRALAEALCYNTTLTMLSFVDNSLHSDGVRRWQKHCVGTPRSARSASMITRWTMTYVS